MRKFMLVLVVVALGFAVNAPFTPRMPEIIGNVKRPYDNIRVSPPSSVSGRASDDYFKALLKYFMDGSFSWTGGERYPNLAWKGDNTLALLGYLNKGWAVNQKTFADYLRELNSVQADMSKGRLKSDNYGDDQDNYMSVAGGVVAGFSYGKSIHPSSSAQVGSYKDPYKTYYAFKVGQQKVREAVLKEHMERVVLLKKELSFLYSLVNRYCSREMVEYEYMAKTPPTPDVLVGGTGTLYYRPIIRAIEDQTAWLLDVGERSLKLKCVDYMAKLHAIKVEIEQTEISLYQLSALYGLLENDERKLIDSVGR